MKQNIMDYYLAQMVSRMMIINTIETTQQIETRLYYAEAISKAKDVKVSKSATHPRIIKGGNDNGTYRHRYGKAA